MGEEAAKQKTRSARVRQRAPSRYLPPATVSTTTLTELLGQARDIPASPAGGPQNQQHRFGFSEARQAGLRLWYAGDPALVERQCVAIVGTRRVSPEGAARARRLARELADAGVVVVSGLAAGVDTEALTAAIEAGGKVIAIIGTPLERAYPMENAALQERIWREHLLVSQFAPGTPVHKGNFPTRNKLMAALADATVIIEAGEASGTLHQAVECQRLGRWLFIAKSAAEDLRLAWPANFLNKPKTEALATTADVVKVLPRRT